MYVALLTIRLLGLLQWLLVFRALASWFPQIQSSRIGEILYMVTEPMVAPCRSLLSRIPSLQMMPLDFSALLAFLILSVLQRFLLSLMF